MPLLGRHRPPRTRIPRATTAQEPPCPSVVPSSPSPPPPTAVVATAGTLGATVAPAHAEVETVRDSARDAETRL